MSLGDKVFKIVTRIPRGYVTTYKAIGDSLGCKGYQAIGQLLKRNVDAPTTPCHRVIRSDRTVGGYLGSRTVKKIKLLESEGVKIDNGKVNFNQVLTKID